jgi:hypothetical protein
MNILAYLSASVHLDGLAFQLWKLQLDGCTGVGCWYLELKSELVSDKVVSVGADSLPFDAILGRLDLKPIVVLLFVGLYVYYDGFELLFESIFPFFVFGASVYGQEGDIGRSFLDRAHHVDQINIEK